MATPRNSTPVLINRDQLDKIRQIQEEERRSSGIGVCPSIHTVARSLIDAALAQREQEGKNNEH
ncbi:hypothetical protein ACIPMZ_17975 [Scandinavium goeteborgense]|uniref:hypothetical protein n=1 Tax=Scandinavium goeteborgense TaxID=1851514 RepID=UPI003816A8AB